MLGRAFSSQRPPGLNVDGLVTMVSLKAIQDARRRIAPYVRTTAMLDVGQLHTEGPRLALKLENLQRTGAFKIRGASNCLAQLADEEKARGVIAASAGNHAQGVAAAAKAMGIRATIVMPRDTPVLKVDRTRSHGAEVVLSGTDFDEANLEARRRCTEEGLVFVHPFADERVISGQGTIGLEVLDQCSDVSSVVVPVGGGGLISGIAVAIKSQAPHVKVFGVQSEMAPAMHASLCARQPTVVAARPTIAEGIAVGRPEAINCRIVREYVDDIVTVSDGDVATAMLRLMEDHKLIVEGAGAAPLAAVDALANRLGHQSVLVLSGGNADVTTLGSVIDRGLAEAGRSVRLLVDLQDIPGALAKLAEVLSRAQANIIEIYHNRLTGELEVGKAEVEVVLSTRGPDHVAQIVDTLIAGGYRARHHEHG